MKSVSAVLIPHLVSLVKIATSSSVLSSFLTSALLGQGRTHHAPPGEHVSPAAVWGWPLGPPGAVVVLRCGQVGIAPFPSEPVAHG